MPTITPIPDYSVGESIGTVAATADNINGPFNQTYTDKILPILTQLNAMLGTINVDELNIGTTAPFGVAPYLNLSRIHGEELRRDVLNATEVSVRNVVHRDALGRLDSCYSRTITELNSPTEVDQAVADVQAQQTSLAGDIAEISDDSAYVITGTPDANAWIAAGVAHASLHGELDVYNNETSDPVLLDAKLPGDPGYNTESRTWLYSSPSDSRQITISANGSSSPVHNVELSNADMNNKSLDIVLDWTPDVTVAQTLNVYAIQGQSPFSGLHQKPIRVIIPEAAGAPIPTRLDVNVYVQLPSGAKEGVSFRLFNLKRDVRRTYDFGVFHISPNSAQWYPLR